MICDIKQGHVLNVLRAMPAESVHCVVTSPPYYGLRDYGIEPTIWGGDRAHTHEWGDQIISNGTNHTGKTRWNHARNGRGEEQPPVQTMRSGDTRGDGGVCGVRSTGGNSETFLPT